MAVFEAAGVVGGPVLTIADIAQDPHYRAREDIVSVPDEHFGSVRMQGVTPRFVETPGAVRHSGRDIGADTASILATQLGLAPAEIERLTRLGAVWTARNPYADVFLVGAGQAPYRKQPGQPVMRVLWEALDAGLRNARLPFRSVQGLAVSCFTLPPDNVTTVAEHFGIEARFLYQGLYGGASGVSGLLHAARAIRDGDADVVAVLGADVFDVAAHNAMLDHFNGSVRDYMAPMGFGGANGMFALQTRAYMDAFGATAEDLALLPLAQRANAQGNPNALFRGQPMTLADYLAARPIADPLRLYDCVLPCTGGDCVILASPAVARTLAGPMVRIMGGGEMHNFPAEDVYALRSGWEDIAPRMYAQAGIGPADLHFAQLYDDYPVMEFLQLEGLGIAPARRQRGVPAQPGRAFRRGVPGQHRRWAALRRAGGCQRGDDRSGRSRPATPRRGRRAANSGQPGRGGGVRHGRVWPRPVVQRVHPGAGRLNAPPRPRVTAVNAPFWEGCNRGGADAAALRCAGLRPRRVLPRASAARSVAMAACGGSRRPGAGPSAR